MAADRRQTPGAAKEQWLAAGVDQDVEAGRHHTCGRPQAQAHEDVADLGNRGVGQHPLDVIFPHGLQRPQDHAQKAKGQNHVCHAQLSHQLHGEHPHHHGDHQHDVSLEHQAREHGRRCRGGAAVGIRQPKVEGEHGAFDAKSSDDQSHRHRQWDPVIAALCQLRHRLGEGGHQEVAGDAVEQRQSDEEQSRAQKTHK